MNSRRKIELLVLVLVFALILFIFKINPKEIPVEQTANTSGTIESTSKELPKKDEVVLLGRAKISFVGSSKERIHNIELGLKRLDGKIIPAGDEFSFWQAFGLILASDGFQEANVFSNGEIISSIGGGLCQISTTLFQSAVEAGLPITERTSHVFSVSYYRTGLDATVSKQGPDLKFLNDTGFDITIKSYVEDASAVFELYGVYDGRMAVVSKAEVTDIVPPPPTRYIEIENMPKSEEYCEHTSQRGYTAKVKYKVTYPDGNVKEKTFNSTYRPYAKICYISKDPVTGCTTLTNYSPTTGVKCQN